jgi:hypothetical protein
LVVLYRGFNSDFFGVLHFFDVLLGDEKGDEVKDAEV